VWHFKTVQAGLSKLAKFYTWNSNTYNKLLTEVFQLKTAPHTMSQ